MIKAIRYGYVLLSAMLILLPLSCGMTAEDPEQAEVISPPDVTSGDGIHSVYRLRLDNGGGAVTLDNLNSNDVFLVMVNTTDSNITTNPIISTNSAISADASGEASVAPLNTVSGDDSRAPAGFVTVNGETLVRYERRMRIEPPAFVPNKSLMVTRSAVSAFKDAKEGDTKQIYADVSSSNDVPTAVPATLKKQGTYCNIWVADSNFTASSSTSSDNKVTQDQINALANKFDAIYPLETNLLGYEYGGELLQGEHGYGGMDGDPCIQILICDIDGDYNTPRNGVTLGYFYAVDEYANGTYNNPSNEAEIFYLDAEILDAKPNTIYSTLIHEFNHMINFNVKVKQQGNKWSNFETWYTEMLSLLAEDAIGPLVGIPSDQSDNGNVIRARIPSWLSG
jgi:hypothetical protein